MRITGVRELWTKRRRRPPSDDARPAFPWRDYRDAHRDLHGTDEAEATRHYQAIGRAEGRLASAEAIAARITQLESSFGPLPERFAWLEYLANYPDLGHIVSIYDAAEHYLRFGRAEGRLHQRFDGVLYRALYMPDAGMSEEALLEHWITRGRTAGLISTYEALAARYNTTGTTWLRRLDVAAFALLNAPWAGPIRTVEDALAAMIREGFERLAPLEFEQRFDPAYYREANPGLAHREDADLYRHWLFEGLDGGRPGSAADHLGRHGLQLLAFPDGFDWQRYATLPGVFGDSRWAFLDHVVAHHALPAAATPVREPGGAAFLSALAITIVDRSPDRGLALFAEAQRHGELPQAAAARWGRALADAGRWADAADVYEVALRRGDLAVPTVAAAAHALCRAARVEPALAILTRAQPHAGGDMRFRQAVAATIEALYAAERARAAALYATNRRDDADALLGQLVARVAALWAQLDPTGIVVPPEPTARVVMLANVDLPQCTHYRVEQKAEVAALAGTPLAIFPANEAEAFLSALPGASAAIFYRVPATPMTVRAITVARALGVPTFYDIDDLIFDPAHYPEPLASYGTVTPAFHQSLQMGVPLFRAAMALCDRGIASTTDLARHMDGVVREGVTAVLPNGIDSHNAGWLAAAPARVRRDGAVVMFYGSGTRAHNSDFLDLAGDAVLATMTRHPDVRLVIAGYLTLDGRFDAVRDRVVQVGWVADLEAYWSLLIEADINLAVLAPGPTTDPKSEIKWLEAAALGVPSVVGATHRYREVLTHGEDVLIAATPAAWAEALDTLVARPDRRAAIVRAARAKARATYGLASNAARWRSLLAPAFAQAARHAVPPPRARRRWRLLLINIFFPPQTIGGSTRVVRDNIDSLLASPFAAECELAVVTSDNDNPDPYRMRVDDYRSVPVFRLSAPPSPLMEWRPFDAAMGALFGRVLDMWQPDLIHVHSIQRLTASILLEAQARAVPYINTLHDAWWVSDYHFLVDGEGRLREPEEAMPLHPPPGVSVGESIDRRRRLRPLLEGSAEILSVSAAFTALHHRAGYPRTRCVANGVPPLGPVVRSPSPDGRVRLAHIGSQTHHKGYHLVQAALTRGAFQHFDLTVIDHSRFGGPEIHARWGTTPVRFVGKTRQEEMHSFYGTVDVLLAPSVWPESFGLVAREALAAGLWVLASDRGAMGEDVTHGTNGWVIDVSSLEPLMATLATIDAAPERYCRPPPPRHPPRTAEDQARELIGIYREVLSRAPPATRIVSRA